MERRGPGPVDVVVSRLGLEEHSEELVAVVIDCLAKGRVAITIPAVSVRTTLEIPKLVGCRSPFEYYLSSTSKYLVCHHSGF